MRYFGYRAPLGLFASSHQLTMPATTPIPPIQISIEDAPMTPAIHPQTNTLAMDTRVPMRARCNHSDIAKVLFPSLSWGKGRIRSGCRKAVS